MTNTTTTPEGRTTCCGAYTTISDGIEHCRACSHEVTGYDGLDAVAAADLADLLAEAASL